ncbi:uncharacterized protein [Diabrotica undecimpunctata]|uniref:uncharacterized protein n=1 Tax=Diabrotica undecimpunctata TaxID=50387 RepID=UPI003B63A0A8
MDDEVDVKECIERMIELRKTVPALVYQSHKMIYRHHKEQLRKLKIDLPDSVIKCEIPNDVIGKLEELKNHSDYEHNKKMYEQMKLLDILRSKNCAINKIIDEIYSDIFFISLLHFISLNFFKLYSFHLHNRV